MSEINVKSTTVTRNKSLNLPLCQLVVGKKNYQFAAIELFNLLPKKLHNFKSNITTAKVNLKNWLRNENIALL